MFRRFLYVVLTVVAVVAMAGGAFLATSSSEATAVERTFTITDVAYMDDMDFTHVWVDAPPEIVGQRMYILCLAEDPVCFAPVSWEQVHENARLYEGAGTYIVGPDEPAYYNLLPLFNGEDMIMLPGE